MATPPEIRVGISGWRYAPWRGVFYPQRLRQKDELDFASRQFPSIEINGTFYSLQRPHLFETWYAETPADFVFAVKGSRYITHMLRLKGADAGLANFFASGVLLLKEKLGPFLWQFPASFAFDEARLDAFLTKLPRDTDAAAAIATHHDHRVAGRSWFGPQPNRALCHAIEVRHPSFADPAFIALLRRHGVALVVADGFGLPYHEDVTADFLYLRLHGSEELYASGYAPAALDAWAARIAAWSAGREPADRKVIDRRRPAKRAARDVYVYFDNDAKVRAPFDAQNLAARLQSF
ncbi:MAG: hypothetical protein JWL84_5612 [Rhodospirillales bacterium]|jgi:uncharacterized protein YecE (DUF72 family)|nr:hypothetical protein [Rhodospirillales bacterium]